MSLPRFVATPPRTTARLRTVTAMVATGSLLATLAACGSDGEELSSGSDFSVTAAIAELPTGALAGDWVYLSVGDVSGALEATGLDRSEDPRLWWTVLTSGASLNLMSRDASDGAVSTGGVPTDTDETAGASADEGIAGDAEFAPVLLVPPAMLSDQMSLGPDQAIAEVGWAATDIDSYVTVYGPPRDFTVVTGPFDEDTLAPGLIDLGEGVVSLGEGEDFESNLTDRTSLSPIGRPTRIAQDGERIALSSSTDQVRAWLDGERDEDPVLAVVTRALDEKNVLSAVVARPASGELAGGAQLSPEQIRELAEEGLSTPFDLVGLGWSATDEGEARVSVVYSYANEASAQQAAPELETLYREGASIRDRRPYSDVLELESVQVTENLVIVDVLPVASPFVPMAMVVSREHLFTSP